MGTTEVKGNSNRRHYSTTQQCNSQTKHRIVTQIVMEICQTIFC